MLYAVDSGKYIQVLPHEKEFNIWRNNLSDNDYNIIADELLTHFTQNEVDTSSWIPGEDWRGTVYQPLYHACRDNAEAAGLFFGLIIFKTLMDNRDKVWGFGRYEKDGVPIRGMTYFVINSPPEE